MGTAVACAVAVLVLALLFGQRGAKVVPRIRRPMPLPVPDASWNSGHYYVVPAVHHRSADETMGRKDGASDARDDLDDGGDGE